MGEGMSDIFDQATDREMLEREISLRAVRSVRFFDSAPLVCSGCDAFPQQRECGDFKDCLVDFERRESAKLRNGGAS